MIDQLAQAPNKQVKENPIRDFPDLAMPEKPDHPLNQEQSNQNSEQINQLHQDPIESEVKEEVPKTSIEQNYIKAFIDNKLVSKVFPDIMNWVNIAGNTFSLAAHGLGFSDRVKDFAKGVGALSTKSFMIATSVINIVERCYTKNFLSALGFFNDIMIASTVGQEDTYLARGTASGTYNLGNSLADSVNRQSFNSFEDHVTSTFKALHKFVGNFFSTNIVENFKNHKNGMWAIFGGLGSNLGAISWMLSGKTKIPTIIRDVCGVLMDIEQLNPGHLKAGRKNFFWSGVSLGVGTVSDLLMRFVPPQVKDLLIPMTYIFDGLGRHLLRLDRNEQEMSQGVELAAA